MSDKTLSEMKQELLELQVTRLINKQNGIALERGATFGQIVYSQRNTAKRIIALLREHMV